MTSANTDPPPGSNSIALQRGAPLSAARFDHVSVQKAIMSRMFCDFSTCKKQSGFVSAQRTVRHKTTATHHLPAVPSTHQFLSLHTCLCVSPVQHGCRDGLAADEGGHVSFLVVQTQNNLLRKSAGFPQKNICRPQTHRVGSSTPSREKHFLRSGSSMSLRGREFLYRNIARCSFASSRVFFMSSIRS